VTLLDREGRRVLGDPLASGVKFSLDLANTYGGCVSEVLYAGDRRLVLVAVQARDRRAELQNVLERAVILSSGPVIELEDITEDGAALDPAPEDRRLAPSPYPFEGLNLGEVGRRHIQHLLPAASGQKTRASEVLCINSTTLWKELRQHEEHPEQTPDEP
jgi:hypothetical protein